MVLGSGYNAANRIVGDLGIRPPWPLSAEPRLASRAVDVGPNPPGHHVVRYQLLNNLHVTRRRHVPLPPHPYIEIGVGRGQTLKTVKEFMIPKCKGRSFTIKKGELLRIIEVDGPQAADMVAFNEHDLRESFSAWLTRQSSRSFTRTRKLLSKLPAGNVMFTVLTDVPGIYWLTGGRCNSLLYKTQYGVKRYHRNCHDILAECLKPHGLSEWEVPEVFNVFMNAKFTVDGTYEFEKSPVSKGDYVDLRADMDCLVAVSACPDDIGEYNERKPKALKIQIQK